MLWQELLKREAEDKGQAQVAKELGVNKSTISLVLSGKYPAGTEKIEERVMNIYGNNGQVSCPGRGNEEISPSACAETRKRAKDIGLNAGNLRSLKLYKTCLKCAVRI
ncbi:MAG: helix-turn-helix transcriptional regulator [Nitrospiraceae bacterium]|nr:helix-turn-helix transcriptional regulator [Nitrospiraceae bacterium]